MTSWRPLRSSLWDPSTMEVGIGLNAANFILLLGLDGKNRRFPLESHSGWKEDDVNSYLGRKGTFQGRTLPYQTPPICCPRIISPNLPFNPPRSWAIWTPPKSVLSLGALWRWHIPNLIASWSLKARRCCRFTKGFSWSNYGNLIATKVSLSWGSWGLGKWDSPYFI